MGDGGQGLGARNFSESPQLQAIKDPEEEETSWIRTKWGRGD